MNFVGLMREATREVIAFIKKSTIIQQVSKVNFHIPQTYIISATVFLKQNNIPLHKITSSL